MSDSHTTLHVPIWGFSAHLGISVIGTVSVDRTGPSTTYMAQNGDKSTTWTSEAAAAEWLWSVSGIPCDYVLIGRVFRPDRIVRQSAAEQVHRSTRAVEDVFLPDSARDPVGAAH